MTCSKSILKVTLRLKLIVILIVDNGQLQITYQHQELCVCYTLVTVHKTLHFRQNYQLERQQALMENQIFTL